MVELDSTQDPMASVRTFHASLIAIDRAGLPIPIALRGARSSLAQRLSEIETQLAMHFRASGRISDALQTVPDISPDYRSALNIWLHSGGNSIALESLVGPAMASGRLRGLLSLSYLQPFILLVFGFFSLIFITWVTAAQLVQFNSTYGHESGFILTCLHQMKLYSAIWIPAGGAFIAGLGLYLLSRNKSLRGQNSSRSQVTDAIETANYTDRIRVFMENAMPQPQAVIAAGYPKSLPRPPATSINNDTAAPETTYLMPMPPLLKWALEGRTDGDPNTEALSFASESYRRLSEFREQRLRNWLVPVMAAALGGLIVLLIGLSIFAPLIDLLSQVAT